MNSFLSSNKIIKIDCLNNVSYYDDNTIVNIKVNLFKYFENQEENFMELQYLLNKINPSWRLDSVLNSQTICNDIRKKHIDFIITSEECLKLLETFCNRQYNMEFFGFENYIEDLSKILIKVFNILEKEYKIQTYKDLYIIINPDSTESGLKRFRRSHSFKNTNFLNSPISNKKITPNSNIGSSGGKITSKPGVETKFSSSSFFKPMFENIANCIFPDGIKGLIDQFSFIKSLKLFIPNKNFILENYILVLSNLTWLFPNLLQIDLDLETYLFAETNPRDTIMDEKCENFIQTNKDKFLLLILISYYIGNYDGLKTLNLKIPESFEIEISSSLKSIDIQLKNFHFLDFFNNTTSLYELTVEFNSLDSGIFQRILGLLHKNNSLRYLKINFFPENQELYFTQGNLLRLCKSQNINTENSLAKIDNDKAIMILESELDDNDFYLRKLKQQFQINVEKLFFVLTSKLVSINELSILIDFPYIIRTNDNYIRVFHKFLCNLIVSLEYVCEQLQTLELNCQNLPFDPVEYPILATFMKKLNLKNNTKLINLNIMFGFNRVTDIENLFPDTIQDLKIGDFDTDSFISFVHFWKDAEQGKFSKNLRKLQSLKISISSFKFNAEYGYKYIKEFFSIAKPKSLKEIEFTSSVKLNQLQINDVLRAINYDSVPRYTIQFANKQLRLKNKKYIDEIDDIMYTRPNYKVIYALLFALKYVKNGSGEKLLNSKYLIKNISLISNFIKIQKKKLLEIELVD